MPSAPRSGPVVGALTSRVSTATTETWTTMRWPVVASPVCDSLASMTRARARPRAPRSPPHAATTAPCHVMP
eukprot:scaffold2094_cov48-Phaeocystis_antarctica.AAC.1